MERYDVYRTIAERTGGDIYIGVVGPVRTGKSTFIKKFMDHMVLPNIEEGYVRDRTMDEIPQSGSGKTIMTTQPHFVPNEAVEVSIRDCASFNVRLVDCVGYMVKGALGLDEGETPRMVRTPWYAHDIPFEEAAEVGTRKVIHDHSTIGVLVTSDGSVTDIPRTSYVEAEERVVRELKAIDKPFVIVLNTRTPDNVDAKRLRTTLEEKYDAPVLLADVFNMSQDDISLMLESMLFEFPVSSIHMDIPDWVMALDESHWLPTHILEGIREASAGLSKVRDYPLLEGAFVESPYASPPQVTEIQLGDGSIQMNIPIDSGLYYKVLGEECGYEVHGEAHLLALMKDLVSAKKEYDRVADALDSVRRTGYGLVSPSQEELTLEEPELVRQGNRFGVRLKASAPSLHVMWGKRKGGESWRGDGVRGGGLDAIAHHVFSLASINNSISRMIYCSPNV